MRTALTNGMSEKDVTKLSDYCFDRGWACKQQKLIEAGRLWEELSNKLLLDIADDNN